MALKILVLLFVFLKFGHGLELKSGAYEGLVISISDNVPVDQCKSILHNLGVSCFYFLIPITRNNINAK